MSALLRWRLLRACLAGSEYDLRARSFWRRQALTEQQCRWHPESASDRLQHAEVNRRNPLILEAVYRGTANASQCCELTLRESFRFAHFAYSENDRRHVLSVRDSGHHRKADRR